MGAKDTLDGINRAIAKLVEVGLADDQNFAFLTSNGLAARVDYPSNTEPSFLLRQRPYSESYARLREQRAYNVLMLDGALVQLSYRFAGKEVVWHRLAFLPSPSLETFQNEPEMYEGDHLYADIIDRRIVTVPCRFDYDPDASAAREHHPASHFTLGQYQNCRIPVTAPVPPDTFFHFVLSSFYNTPLRVYSDSLPAPMPTYPACITEGDRALVHLAIP